MSELLTTVLVVLLLMVFTWAISGRRRDASVVDIAWGSGFVLIAWAIYLRFSDGETWAQILLWMVTVWGLRLTIHIASRNIKKGEEDYRYQAMRARDPDRFWLVSLFKVFLFQGLLMTVVSLPVQFGIGRPPISGWLAPTGVILYLVGLSFEAIGDWQLARFKADPGHQGRVMDRGLWRFTRHPNYFGDFCVWWGIFLVALAAGHWWTIIGPIIMSALLMKYSGAGLLEKTIVSRRPGYEEYVARTNRFFPGPPKRKSQQT